MKQNKVKDKKPYLIGITGGIGSGKSEVSKYLISLGYPLIDADVVSREVVEPGEIGLSKIVELFGESLLNQDQSLNRGKLGEIIFNNEILRIQLNDTLHPLIRLRMKQHLDAFKGARIVFFDIPLLFETQSSATYDAILLVYASESECLKRIISRDNMSRELALKKIKAQMPIDQKRALSDYVIENSGDLASLHKQIDTYLKSLDETLKQ